MSLRPMLVLSLLLAAPVALAQTAPAPNPASAPAPKPMAAPAPGAQASPPASPVQTNPAAAPMQPQNPAAAPMQPQSDAGATERGLAPVKPANAGVTQRVRDANARDADPQGHTLDPHGKPVGQAPAPSTTVR